MIGLITDRTQRNVSRRATLNAKGWQGMTDEERAEWLGDIFASTKSNLLPCGPYYSSAVEVKHWNEEIVATATVSGTYLYAILIIGNAADFADKTLTFSIEAVDAPENVTPMVSFWWHDNDGYEYAGASLSGRGSVTFNTADFPNISERQNLAAYVYVTTDAEASVGASVRFKHAMLNNGASPSKYAPYTEILATDTTKGAYNYSDLNRVERTVAEISDLGGLGLTAKTDWQMWDIPTADDMTRYLGNISVIRSRYANNANVPAVPTSMNHLTFVEANNIEKILFAAYEAVSSK